MNEHEAPPEDPRSAKDDEDKDRAEEEDGDDACDDYDYGYCFEDDAEEKKQEQRSGTKELLWLLFEMASFVLAEADPTEKRFVTTCEKGHDSIVSMVPAADTQVLISKEDKAAALLSAIWAGHEATVRVLVVGGAEADPEWTNNSRYSHTPLGQAAAAGYDNIARFLLKGPKLERPFSDYTPLLAAARHGHVGAFEMLLDSGADLEQHK